MSSEIWRSKYYSLSVNFVYFILISGTNIQSDNNVKYSSQGFQLTQSINVQRQEHLQKACRILGYKKASLSSLKDFEMDHMLIDHKHKFLYCYVPKVACTNWKRVLMVMTNQWQNGSNPLNIPAYIAHSSGVFEKLNSVPTEQRENILAEYTKFIVARHPFERLLSAYRNKLEGNSTSAKYFQKRIGRIIVREFRKNARNESLENGNDVTFEEFIKYLLTPKLSLLHNTNQSSFNEHWEPIAKLCHPCIIKYNIIGKYETLLDDSSLALFMSGAENVTFPSGYKSSRTNQQLRKYFETIPINHLRSLFKIYEEDFRLFGYDLQDMLGYEFD